jgi:hypothetical protein
VKKQKIGLERRQKALDNDWLPLTPAQNAIANRIAKGEHHNKTVNLYTAILLNPEVDLEKIRRSCNILVTRQQALRLVVGKFEGNFRQRVCNERDFVLFEVFDGEFNLNDEAVKFVRKKFDLNEAPLVRCGLFVTKSEGVRRNLLVLSFSNLVADNFSCEILFREFVELLNGVEKPAVETSFCDFISEISRPRDASQLACAIESWDQYIGNSQSMFIAAERELKELPYVETTARLNSIQFFELERLCRRRGATVFIVFLAALALNISDALKRNDVLIRTPVSWRGRYGTQNCVGMFADNLAIKVNCPEEATFSKIIDLAGQSFLRAYAIQKDFRVWDLHPGTPPTTPVQLIVSNRRSGNACLSKNAKIAERHFLSEPSDVNEKGRTFVVTVRPAGDSLGIRTYFDRACGFPESIDISKNIASTIKSWIEKN